VKFVSGTLTLTINYCTQDEFVKPIVVIKTSVSFKCTTPTVNNLQMLLAHIPETVMTEQTSLSAIKDRTKQPSGIEVVDHMTIFYLSSFSYIHCSTVLTINVLPKAGNRIRATLIMVRNQPILLNRDVIKLGCCTVT
jgi:hypothetical protein